MDVETLIDQGLERFTAGDLAGAGRLWLAAREQVPRHPRLQAYLDHLRQQSPETMAELEMEAELEAVARLEAETELELEAAAEAGPIGAALETSAAAAAKPAEPPVRNEGGAAPGSAAPGAGARAPARAAAEIARDVSAEAAAGAAAVVDVWAQGGSPLAPLEVSSRGPGLGLVAGGPAVAPALPQEDLESLVSTMRELMSLDNFSGALGVAHSVLSQDPQNAEARRVAAVCRERLQTIYVSKLGSLQTIPSVRMPPGEVIWLDLDHRSGFVLAQVDGASSYEEIIELTGMDRLEALRILCDLLQKQAIGTDPQ